MGSLLYDLRHAARALAARPGLMVAAVLSLALGVGANTALFTFLSALFFDPVPVAEPARLVSVFTTDEEFPGMLPTSWPNYRDLREDSETFSGLAAFLPVQLSLSGSGEPEKIDATLVSGNFFDVLGVSPAPGRALAAGDDRPGSGAPVAVIAHGLWQRRFGGDPGLLGRTITLNGQPITVVGIAPEGFHGALTLRRSELWLPLALEDRMLAGTLAAWFDLRGALMLGVIGRLAEGVSREQAGSSLSARAAALAEEYPDENRGRTWTLLPYLSANINPNERPQYVRTGGMLAAVVALVLLVACGNVANLLLARAVGRRREIAVRLALGAGRGRLLRQLLAESLLLALGGGALGLVVAALARSTLWALRPPGIPEGLDLSFDARVLAFTLLLSLATGLLFGLAPALRSARTPLVDALKAGGRSGSGEEGVGASGRGILARLGLARVPLGHLLVGAQVALSLVALIGAGLFLRGLGRAQAIDPGFAASELAVVTFDLGSRDLAPQDARALQDRLLERVRALPGVRAAALGQNLAFVTTGLARPAAIEGHRSETGEEAVFLAYQAVSPGYFEALGIPLLAGRSFEEADREGNLPVAVVNRTFAESFWGEAGLDGALGRAIAFDGEEAPVRVVGVVEDARYFTLGEDPRPYLYLPLGQSFAPETTLHIRTASGAGSPASLLGAVRREIRALDPNLALYNVEPMMAILARSLWAPRMAAGLLAVFGGVALVLVSVGIYGVMAYSVNRRRREIGIRAAIGADRRRVLGGVLGRSMKVVGAGAAAGLLLAFLATRAVAGLLYGIRPFDPVSVLGMTFLLLLVAFVASLLPALQATRVDPVVVLRDE